MRRRYRECAKRFKVPPRDLTPSADHDPDGIQRAYPVMEQVIAGIEAGDAACIEIGVAFIEEDQRFPFGRTLKSNTARALRRAARRGEVTGYQMHRIRYRVLQMLRAGHVPREYREYAKLLRTVGFEAKALSDAFEEIDHQDPHVMRFYRYFEYVLRERERAAGP